MKTKTNSNSKLLRKLTLVDTPLNVVQMLTLLQKTPKAHVYTRPAKGGGVWEYVTGVYVKQTLNKVFGYLWSFEIISMKETHGQAVCQGKLSVNQPNGQPLVWKMDIGKSDIKYRTEMVGGVKTPTDKPLDYGNDEKAAVTDCLKRCAFQLGIASDIYGRMEFKDITSEFLAELPKKGETAGEVSKEVLKKSEIKIDEMRKEIKK